MVLVLSIPLPRRIWQRVEVINNTHGRENNEYCTHTKLELDEIDKEIKE